MLDGNAGKDLLPGMSAEATIHRKELFSMVDSIFSPEVIPLWPDGAPGSEHWSQQEQETYLPPSSAVPQTYLPLPFDIKRQGKIGLRDSRRRRKIGLLLLLGPMFRPGRAIRPERNDFW